MKARLMSTIKKPFAILDERVKKECERLSPKARVSIVFGLCSIFFVSFIIVLVGSLYDINMTNKILDIEHITPLDLNQKKDSLIINNLRDYGR